MFPKSLKNELLNMITFKLEEFFNILYVYLHILLEEHMNGIYKNTYLHHLWNF